MALINSSSSSLFKTYHTYIVVLPSSSSPFYLQVSSNKPLNLNFREYSIKKGKGKDEKGDDGKIKQVAEFDLDNLKENDFIKKLDGIINLFPVLDLDPYYKRSVSPVYDKWMPLNHQYFYLKLTSENKSIFPLYSMKTFWLVAMRYGEKVLVFQEKMEFAEVCKILVDKEGIKKTNIEYRSITFDPDSLSYSYPILKSSIELLSAGIHVHEAYMYCQGLNRIFGLGFCFMMRDWASFFQYMVKYKKRKARVPSPRMIEVRRNWTDISQYIHTAGEKQIRVKGVRITLLKLKQILFTVHSRQGTAEEKVVRKVGVPQPEPPTAVPWVNPAPDRIVPTNPSRKYSTLMMLGAGGQRRPVGKLLYLLARGIK